MIRATTRCRVDLGGGTLDLWPIGLLHRDAVTVNVAIDLPVTVTLAERGEQYVVRQGGVEKRVDDRAALVLDPDTALVGLVAEELDLPPVEVTIDSASPRGAGLGASSAVTIALLAAGQTFKRVEPPPSALQRSRIARDLEARLMGLPTGCQDHLPAELGGALAIELRPGGERVRRLYVDLAQLGARMIVAYTGQSHFSAANNWQVVRRRFDGDPEVVARLDAIARVARALPAALEAGEWAEVGRLVGEEWQARRGLAPEIDTPMIEQLLATARELGGFGGKACGAGGGGSIVVLAPPERIAAIGAAWRSAGATLLDAPPTARGLDISRS